MEHYFYKVEKNVDPDGKEVYDVVERGNDGTSYGADSTHANEVDAIISAFFMNAWQKIGNYDLASIATAKYILKNGLRPVNIHIKFFDNATGQYDGGAMWNYLWESANG